MAHDSFARLHTTLHADIALHLATGLNLAPPKATRLFLDKDDRLLPLGEHSTDRYGWYHLWGDRTDSYGGKHVRFEQTFGVLDQATHTYCTRHRVDGRVDGNDLGGERTVWIGGDTHIDRGIEANIRQVTLVYICKDPHGRQIGEEKQGSRRISPEVLPWSDFALDNRPGNRGANDCLAVYLAAQARHLFRFFAEERQAMFHCGKRCLRTPLLIEGAGEFGVSLLQILGGNGALGVQTPCPVHGDSCRIESNFGFREVRPRRYQVVLDSDELRGFEDKEWLAWPYLRTFVRQHFQDTTSIWSINGRQPLLVKTHPARGVPFDAKRLLAHWLNGELLELLLIDDSNIGWLGCHWRGRLHFLGTHVQALPGEGTDADSKQYDDYQQHSPATPRASSLCGHGGGGRRIVLPLLDALSRFCHSPLHYWLVDIF